MPKNYFSVFDTNKNCNFEMPAISDYYVKTGLTINGSVIDKEAIKWISNHADEIEDIIVDAKAKKEQQELKVRQVKNKYYRSLVKHIKFSGDACIIYWNDGTQTVSRWDHFEDFDPEKAILAAMAKKLYGGTNIYCEVLKEYADDGWNHWYNTDDLDYC